MDEKAITQRVENLTAGMLALVGSALFVSPVIGVFIGSALKLGMWLGDFGYMPFGRAFVLGWAGCFAWILIGIILDKVRPIRIENR